MVYGVILWHDRAKGTAVIWCEDQDKLAYAARAEVFGDDLNSAENGDLVEIDYKDSGSFRYCTKLRLVQKKFSNALEDALRGAAQLNSPRLVAVA
ncbi:MAG: hypothetical protein ACJA06_001126 [Halocynthiibacter sp.]|jgi:hypothetical protein